jgi:hypothetical protein
MLAVGAGPLTGFSDTWLLVAATGTSVVAFLMVFLIQHTQNCDTAQVHRKLDALLRAADHGALPPPAEPGTGGDGTGIGRAQGLVSCTREGAPRVLWRAARLRGRFTATPLVSNLRTWAARGLR